MKKIVYLIISIISFSLIFLINFIFNKYTNFGIVENVSKIFLAWDIGITENKIISLEDENVYVEAQANWVEKDIVEVSLGLSDNLYLNDKSKDVVFMLDTSIISNYKFNDIVDESMLAIESLLKNENNKVAIITFDEKAKLIQDFTNDVENVRNSFNDIEYKYERNYNSALNKLDELLNTYEKKEDRDLFVIFISNNDATKDVNTHKSTYKMLKEKYSYLSINGILYDYNNSSNDINEISDTQFFVDEFELMNTLSKIINNGVTFEKFKVNFDITLYYEIVGFSTNNGEVIVGDDNLLVWDMSGKHLVTGYDDLKVRLKLKKDYQKIIGYYQINDSFSIDYKINDIDKISQSHEYLQLRNGFEVSYNLNLPRGCSISRIDTKLHNVYSRVDLHDDLYCEGYEFLGYKIDNVEMINDKSFIMPRHSVIINASWSSNGIAMELDGTIREKTTLYDRIEELSQTTSIVKQYTGEHKDSYLLPATKNVYHFYASNNTEATETLANNNVLFADHCWQILRTTDTGGVKLIYNGEADSSGKCGTDRGNHVGYSSRTSQSLNSSYYYGTSYNYDSVSKTFSLAGNLVKETWSDITSSSLIGKYTCKLSSEDGTCSTLYLVESYNSSSQAKVIPLNSNSHYSQFGTLQFNAANNSLAYVGYMYGDVYVYSSTDGTKTETFTKTQTILSNSTLNTTYYYSDTVDYGTQNSGKYTLVDPYLVSSSDEYPNLIGKYTFRNTSSTYSNTNVYYISYINGTTMYYKQLSNGEVLEELLFGDTIVDNGDGTYTLGNTTTVEYNDWYTNFANYSGKYTCNSQNVICSNPRYISSTSNTGYTYIEVSEKIMISKSREDLKLKDTLLVSKEELIKNNTSYSDYKYTCNTTSDTCTDATLRMITTLSSTGYTYAINRYFGTSVTYENGKYTLVNPLGLESATNLNDISTHHYTCLNGTTECDNVGYIYYYSGSGTMYYITLKNGELSVNDALDKMLNQNTTDSTIKFGIEAWYEKYLMEYSSYFEDVVYCNDRSYKDFNNSGWNENGGKTSNYLYFKQYDNTTDLSCSKQTDQFSVSNDSAKLKYPIGLATSPELNILNNSTVRKTGQHYWLASPSNFSGDYATERNVFRNGNMSNNLVSGGIGVRPAVSLRSGTEYSRGNGSVDSPYVIE